MELKKYKIKSIKKRDMPEYVYDIGVNKVHNYFANNILVHNCHNMGTERLLKVLKYDFKYKIGLSATVDRMDGKHFDIIKSFEYNIFKYTPKEALMDGTLNPFIFYNIGVDLIGKEREDYDRLTQEINVIVRQGGSYNRIMRSNTPIKFTLLAKIHERTRIVNNYDRKFDIVREICRKHKHDKILVFNQFNEQTSKLYWHLLDVGVKSAIVHTGIKKEMRDRALLKFKNDDINIILCSRMLDEGYNIPKTDVAIIMANNSIKRQIIQRIGRVLRKKEKISHIYEVFCNATIEEQYNKERAKFFKELANDYKICNYINDERLREEIC